MQHKGCCRKVILRTGDHVNLDLTDSRIGFQSGNVVGSD